MTCDSWHQDGWTAEMLICILHMVFKKLSLSGVHQSVVSNGDFSPNPMVSFSPTDNNCVVFGNFCALYVP